MKKGKIAYWISTGIICFLMTLSPIMYVIDHDMAANMWMTLGFPTFLIYPLGLAKFLSVVAILSKKSKVLKEWAYSGLFFTFTLAALAHIAANDGRYAPPIFMLVILLISYNTEKLAFPEK